MIFEFLIIGGALGAIACAVYWHRRWTNATKAEDMASRRIVKLETIMYESGLRKQNGEWVVSSPWGSAKGRKGPL